MDESGEVGGVFWSKLEGLPEVGEGLFCILMCAVLGGTAVVEIGGGGFCDFCGEGGDDFVDVFMRPASGDADETEA